MCVAVTKHIHPKPPTFFPQRGKSVRMELDIATGKTGRIEVVIARVASDTILSIRAAPLPEHNALRNCFQREYFREGCGAMT
jgi:hypothetical protein